MCIRVKCHACGKPTYAGCGAHVESVLAGVPAAQRCRCRENGPTRQAATGESGGLVARLVRALKA